MYKLYSIKHIFNIHSSNKCIRLLDFFVCLCVFVCMFMYSCVVVLLFLCTLCINLCFCILYVFVLYVCTACVFIRRRNSLQFITNTKFENKSSSLGVRKSRVCSLCIIMMLLITIWMIIIIMLIMIILTTMLTVFLEDPQAHIHHKYINAHNIYIYIYIYYHIIDH